MTQRRGRHNLTLVVWSLIFWPMIHAFSICHHHSLAGISTRGGQRYLEYPAGSTTVGRQGRRPCSHLMPSQRRFAADQEAPRKLILQVFSMSRGGGDDGSNSSGAEESDDGENPSRAFQGRVLLCLVALLYGTLNVSLRLVYQLPNPPSAAAISTTRGWLASLCFLPLLAFPIGGKNEESKTDTEKSMMNSISVPLLLAGLELAMWNGMAQGLLNVGLLSTGSARASFLTQTSVVLTPLLSLVAGQRVAKGTWAGCSIALVGLTLLSGGGGLSLAFSSGDWLILAGALSWSGYLLRLSQIGPRFDDVQLQFIKTVLLAVLYSTWFVVGLMGGGAGNLPSAAKTAMAWATSPGALAAWGALLYSALGPGTVADVIQQQGQRHVSASEANVLLSMEPVFAAVCARLILGEVTTTPETVGGGLILVAALVASLTSSSDGNSSDEDVVEASGE